MSAAEARAAVRDLPGARLREALICVWVKDPTTFWAALEATAPSQVIRCEPCYLGRCKDCPGVIGTVPCKCTGGGHQQAPAGVAS